MDSHGLFLNLHHVCIDFNYSKDHTQETHSLEKTFKPAQFFTLVKSIFPKMETFQGLQGCSDSHINPYLIFFLTDRNMNESKATRCQSTCPIEIFTGHPANHN